MIQRIINSKFITKHIDKVVNNPSYAAKFLIGATVAKDAFEYAISSVQSLNNKEIPEKKENWLQSRCCNRSFDLYKPNCTWLWACNENFQKKNR
jgi:hypothetical protein